MGRGRGGGWRNDPWVAMQRAINDDGPTNAPSEEMNRFEGKDIKVVYGATDRGNRFESSTTAGLLALMGRAMAMSSVMTARTSTSGASQLTRVGRS